MHAICLLECESELTGKGVGVQWVAVVETSQSWRDVTWAGVEWRREGEGCKCGGVSTGSGGWWCVDG